MDNRIEIRSCGERHGYGPDASAPPRQHVRPGVQRILDAMNAAPAYVRNGRLDILAANQLGRAVFSPIFANAVRPANIARFIFLDPASQEFYVEWDRLAGDTVTLLRAEAGRDPYDRTLSDLVGKLSTRSERFRTLWAAHNVRLHRSEVKHLHYPVVGDLLSQWNSRRTPACDSTPTLPSRAPHRRTRSTCSPVGQPPPTPPVSRRARRPSTEPLDPRAVARRDP